MKPVSTLMGLVGRVDADRVGVPAGVVVRLEHGDVVVVVQEMGADEAGDPGPDDRDLHLSRPPPQGLRRPWPTARQRRAFPFGLASGRRRPRRGSRRDRPDRRPPSASSQGLARPPRVQRPSAAPRGKRDVARAQAAQRHVHRAAARRLAPSQLEPSRAGSAISPSRRRLVPRRRRLSIASFAPLLPPTYGAPIPISWVESPRPRSR